MREGFELVSEVVLGNPTEDMLVTREYLYVYIPTDKIDSIKNHGLNTRNVQTAYFARLPEDKYSDFLSNHTAIRILISRLKKDIKDGTIKLMPKNFKYSKEFTYDIFGDFLKKNYEKIVKMMGDMSNLSKVPSIEIHSSKNAIPATSISVID